MEDENRTARPNSAFLGRMIGGLTRGNTRVIETAASRAAQKAVGSHGAAALRPLLSRVSGKGQAAIRQVALTAAAQQKLTLCSALLSEVALTFGFKLHITNPYGVQVPKTSSEPPSQSTDPSTNPGLVDPGREPDRNVPASASQPSTCAGMASVNALELQDLDVLIVSEDHELGGEKGDGPLSQQQSMARGQRPHLQLGGRLTASALAGALVGGRKISGGAVAGARKRALLMKRQASQPPPDPSIEADTAPPNDEDCEIQSKGRKEISMEQGKAASLLAEPLADLTPAPVLLLNETRHGAEALRNKVTAENDKIDSNAVASSASQTGSLGSKRPTAGLSGLFGAALRDLKKVKKQQEENPADKE